MSAKTLAQLLAGTYPDPDTGAPLTLSTRTVLIDSHLAGLERDAVAALDLGARLAVVSDPITHELLGKRVERALAATANIDSFVLPHHPHADTATVQLVRSATTRADALIAVGSGTINDVCKYASAQDAKPYAVFATAPSMNGYTSPSAAITVAGHKKSLPAQPPLAVFMDLKVLADAPVRMIRSGLGDSLCRPTAQADWLLAHLLRGEPYRTLPFALLLADEAALFAEPDALLARDLAAMERLARTLVLSGFGMDLCGGSYPASQGEHLISHYADMLGDPRWPPNFHGEQIGVTTLTMARLQEELLNGGAPQLGDTEANESDLIGHFGDELGRSCWREFARKRLSAEQRDSVNRHLTGHWPEIQSRIAAISLPAAELENILKRAGAPVRPEQLGWPLAFYRAAVSHAREIRDRYTFLDLAGGSDRLAGFVAAL